MKPIRFIAYLRTFQPILLLAGALFYALGAGIAHYLGHIIDWRAYWLGQAWVTLIQLSILFLNYYFDALPFSTRRLNDTENREVLSLQQNLVVGLAALALMALSTTLLISGHFLNPETITTLAIAFVLAFILVIPPVKLNHSGYGELISALLLTNLFPVIAFLLQTGEMHRLLAMSTFPLTSLYMALALVQALPTFGSDMQRGVWTLMLRLGWKQGMRLHDILVLVGFFLLAVAITLGMPWKISWPALLVLPIGLYQIWQMNQIAGGSKARWNLLTASAIATLGLTAYLLTLGFWIG